MVWIFRFKSCLEMTVIADWIAKKLGVSSTMLTFFYIWSLYLTTIRVEISKACFRWAKIMYYFSIENTVTVLCAVYDMEITISVYNLYAGKSSTRDLNAMFKEKKMRDIFYFVF